MKLTNYIRDAFINRVMDDVPSVDYDQKLRDTAMKAAVAALPPKVQAIWKDGATRCYVTTVHLYSGINMVLPGTSRDAVDKNIKSLIEPIQAAMLEQKKQRDELRSKLRSVAYSVTTRKALAEALPEFEKYLPADEPAALRSLPVVANVVAAFVGAGWPKDGKRKAVAA